MFNLKYTYEFFISLLENQIIVIGLLLSGYSIIILLNLLLIFICRYWAFIESYNFCMFQLLSTKYTKSLIRNAEGVNRILAIERHRLAAQVLGPLFAILQKSFLPVGVGAYFIFYYPNLAIALIPIFIIAFLIFYISSVLTTTFFGQNFYEWFGTIGNSMYTLFQIMTLESWSMGIVRPVMKEYPLAWIFFVPFILVTTFAILNLFIGIIVDAMQQIL